MIYKRRGLLFKLFLSVGVVHTSIRAIKKNTQINTNGKKYQATFSCNRIGKNGGVFHEHSSKWEDTAIIEKINKKYANMNSLIESSHSETSEMIFWTYVFSDRFSYEDWSREIFLAGGFNPYKVDAQFTYNLEEEYV
jgi:hypothetical protein